MSGKRKPIKLMEPPASRLKRVALWLTPAVIVVLGLGGLASWYIRDLPYLHIVAVRVYGSERVPPQDLVELAQIQRGVSLLRIDVERVRRRVMQHPWVREALVHRSYPNELEVIVYERRPNAILESGSSYLIDSSGYIMSKLEAKEETGLPRLMITGERAWTPGLQARDPSVLAGLSLLHQVQEHPFFQQAMVTHVEILSPERFVIHTRRGKLIVGSNLMAVAAKLEFFPVLEEVLRKTAQRSEYVDLSLENQIIVKTSARTTQNAGRLQKGGGASGQAY